MTFPSNFQRVWVRGRMIDLGRAATSATTGDPNIGVNQAIKFTPSPDVLLSAETKHIIDSSVFSVTPAASDGYFQVFLPATDDPDILPTGWTYSVKEPTGRSYHIVVPYDTPTLSSPGDPLDGEQVIELVNVIPASASNPGTVQVIEGRGIASTALDASKHLIISYNDGTEQDAGLVGDMVTQTELADNATADRSRANHTGTQTAATISDFAAEVANNVQYTIPVTIASDGTTDITAALGSWLAGLPAGAHVHARSAATYRIDGTITLSQAVTIDGHGATFTKNTAGKMFTLASSDVAIVNATLQGPTTYYADSYAVYHSSASWASRVYRLTFTGLRVTGFRNGLWIEHAEYVNTTYCRFESNHYSHVMYLSVRHGSYSHNVGDNPVNGGSEANTYGFAATRTSANSLATSPRSEDIDVGHNVQTNTFWECLDTHGGVGIRFHGNATMGARGIAVVAGINESAVSTYAPLNCQVVGNTHDSLVDDGTASSGILFLGTEGGVGTPNELATGIIRGNILKRAGTTETTIPALYCRDTSGLIVAQNRFQECAFGGIYLYYNNYKFQATNNHFEETWTNKATSPFTADIWVRSGYNSGLIEGNIHRATGTRAGTSTKTNDQGLVSGSTSNTSLAVGWNDFSACTIPRVPGTQSTYRPGGPILTTITANRPTPGTAGAGSTIFDTTLNKPIWSDGTNWRDATGAIV